MPLLDAKIQSFINSLVTQCKGINSIWLFGSRANESATDRSDWDFLAFGSEETYQYLQGASELHQPDIDFFVVVNGNDFKSTWGEKDKSGSLSLWEWVELSDECAQYTESKQGENSYASVIKTKKAFRVWPNSSFK